MKRILIASFGATALWAGSLSAQTTERINVFGDAMQSTGPAGSAAISGDGVSVAFESTAGDLVAGDANMFRDVFVRNRATRTTTRVSLAFDGSNPSHPAQFGSIDLSYNGNRVVFASLATNLVSAPDVNGPLVADIFVRDIAADTITRVNVSSGGEQARDFSGESVISGDGRFVAFLSAATNLVPNDLNAASDIFVRDLESNLTERVSLTSGNGEANGDALLPSISDDGRYVLFVSVASNLVPNDTNGLEDVFVRDRLLGTTVCASVASGSQIPAGGERATLSPDGRYAVFESTTTNLVANDTNGVKDAFVHNLMNGTTELVSLTAAGTQLSGNVNDNFGRPPVISEGGRFVVFSSPATNIVADDLNMANEVWLRDRQANTTTRLAVSAMGIPSAGGSGYPTIDDSGRFVAFQGDADDLVGNDNNGQGDVFVRDTGAVIQFAATNYTVNAQSASVEPILLIPGGTVGAATVQVVTMNGSAVAGTDYTALNASLTLPAGTTETNVSIAILTNGAGAFPKQFSVRIASVAGLVVGAASNATVTITDAGSATGGVTTGGGTGGTAGDGSTAGTSGGSSTGAGTTASGGSTGVTGAGGTSAGGTGGQGTNLISLDWQIEVKRPKTDRAIKFKPGKKGLGTVKGTVQTDLEKKSEILVQAALVVSAGTNAVTNAPVIDWVDASKVSKANKSGKVKFSLKKFAADAPLESGDEAEVWVRASDRGFDAAVTETAEVAFSVK